MNIKRLPFTQRGIWNLVVLTLFVLLIAASTTYSIRAWRSTVFANQSPPSLVSTAQSATDGLAADSTTADFTVTGSYLGVVKVNEPVPLGDLDLLFDVVDSIGTLAGQVNSARTQVFLGGPT
ncbi:hypothetical protein KFU94_50775 [Chloroflexi bacterium TSY]|nr:hypothetical protein [Chloroflexi bacterium TSY]